jgi:tetratricopeptide (TPR) repeat protein
LRCLDQALSLWDNDRGSPTADLHDRRGRVLRSLGRPQEAVESLKRALALWDPRAEVDRLVSSAFELGMTYMWQADTAHAVAIVRDTLARIPDASLAQRFTLLQWNAVGLALAADTPAAIEAYRVAQEARKALNSPTADMMAIATEGHFRWATMDLEGAAAGAREAMKRLGEAGLPWLAADASWIAPLSDYFFGRFVSFTELDVLQADARRVGHGPSIGILELLRAYLLMQRGDLTAAVRVSRESMAFNRAMDNRWGFFATFMTGFLEVLQGREKEGLVLLQEAEDSEPPSYWLEQSRRGRFWALAHLKPSEALAMLASSAWEPPDPSRANPFGAWVLPGTVVPALAVLGRREEAAAYAPSAKALIDKGLVCQSWSSSARLTAAIATGCAREWDESEAYFREALNLAAKLPMRPEEAIGRVAYADMLRHRDRPGDRDRARVLTSEAEALSQDLGMALIERHARALRGTL